MKCRAIRGILALTAVFGVVSACSGVAPSRGTGDVESTGLSAGSVDSAGIDFGTFVHDLEMLRRSLHLEELNLLGHSWGGLIAMGYAVTHPNRVNHLVLLSTTEPGTRYADRLRRNLERRGTAADSVERARLFRSPGFRAGLVAVVDSVFRNTFRPWLADPSLADRLSFGLDRAAAERGRRAARFAARNIGSVISWAELPNIRAPTLVIHGERDPIPTEMARELEAGIPDARLVILPEAGHFPLLESPDVTLRSILGFLTPPRNPPSAGDRLADAGGAP